MPAGTYEDTDDRWNRQEIIIQLGTPQRIDEPRTLISHEGVTRSATGFFGVSLPTHPVGPFSNQTTTSCGTPIVHYLYTGPVHTKPFIHEFGQISVNSRDGNA